TMVRGQRAPLDVGLRPWSQPISRLEMRAGPPPAHAPVRLGVQAVTQRVMDITDRSGATACKPGADRKSTLPAADPSLTAPGCHLARDDVQLQEGIGCLK